MISDKEVRQQMLTLDNASIMLVTLYGSSDVEMQSRALALMQWNLRNWRLDANGAKGARFKPTESQPLLNAAITKNITAASTTEVPIQTPLPIQVKHYQVLVQPPPWWWCVWGWAW